MSDPEVPVPQTVVQLTAMVDDRQGSPQSSLVTLQSQRAADMDAGTPIAVVVAGLRAWAAELETAHGLTPAE